MKCDNCDRLLATKQDAKDIPPGEGEHLCWGACEPEDWRARALKAEAERDEARAEVERLRGQLPEGMEHCTIRVRECRKGHSRLTALNWIDHGCRVCALRTVAERQREACAQTMLYVWPSIGPDAAATVRATPLVTEGDK